MNIQNGMIDYEDFFDKFKSLMLSDEEFFNKNFERLLNCMRPKMRWIPTKCEIYNYTYYVCSNCKNEETYCTDFCPQCGAMRIDDE